MLVTKKLEEIFQFEVIHVFIRRRDSDQAMGWAVRVSNSAGARDLCRSSRPALVPTPSPVKWVSGFFARVERPGREVDHSPPSSDEVKNEWSCTSPPPICHGVDHFYLKETCNVFQM